MKKDSTSHSLRSTEARASTDNLVTSIVPYPIRPLVLLHINSILEKPEPCGGLSVLEVYQSRLHSVVCTVKFVTTGESGQCCSLTRWHTISLLKWLALNATKSYHLIIQNMKGLSIKTLHDLPRHFRLEIDIVVDRHMHGTSVNVFDGISTSNPCCGHRGALP